jgi:outer membrane protein TolC
MGVVRMRKQWLALVATLALSPIAVSGTPAGAQPPPAAPAQPAPAQPAPAAPLSQPAIPAVPPVPTTPPRELTLANAIITALQNNYQIRQAAISVVVQQATLRQAQAQTALTLSSVGPTFTYNSLAGGSFASQLGLTTFSLPNTTWTYGLQLRYPLYTGRALEDQIAIAQANLAAQQASFAATAQQVVFTVSQAYYQVQAAQAIIDAAQRAVDASQENVRVTQAQVQVGTTPLFNLLQAQVQLATAQQTLTAARTTQSQAFQNLAAALVLPLSTTFGRVATPPLPEVPQDVNALIQQALQNRPEIAQVLATERAAQAAIDLAASGLRPNVTVTGGPQVTTSDPTVRDFVDFTATISVTLAILDGGLTQAKIDQARAQLQQAQTSELQTRQQVELDVRNAYLALGNAAESLRSALAGQTSAREALRIANVRFQAGVGTQLEVVTQIQNAATADNQVVQASLNYFVAVAQLDRAIGVTVKF